MKYYILLESFSLLGWSASAERERHWSMQLGSTCCLSDKLPAAQFSTHNKSCYTILKTN